jgi:hypothetical protein
MHPGGAEPDRVSSPKGFLTNAIFDLSEPGQYILIIKQPSVEELAEERGDVAV